MECFTELCVVFVVFPEMECIFHFCKIWCMYYTIRNWYASNKYPISIIIRAVSRRALEIAAHHWTADPKYREMERYLNIVRLNLYIKCTAPNINRINKEQVNDAKWTWSIQLANELRNIIISDEEEILLKKKCFNSIHRLATKIHQIKF